MWSDYLCPWCYLALDRSALLESLGVPVTPLPYELHPELPPGGRPVRPGGRLAAVLDRVGEECVEAGLPFRRPDRLPNTRSVLELSEWVRQHHPAAFPALHGALFAAQFAEGRAIDDRATLHALLADAGVDPGEALAAVEAGQGRPLVDRSITRAHEEGVTATPAWLLGSLLVPGVQPREALVRWVRRLLEREGTTTS